MMVSGDIFQPKLTTRKQLHITDKTLCLLFVGQHIWEKNTELIIRSLAKIRNIDYKMFFIGTGYAESDMKNMVYQLGISQKVSFIGLVNNRDLLQTYYAAADLFVFPSIYDNAPLVAREAATFHTPSIMVKNSTAAEVIRDGINGFLRDNTVDSLASCIESFTYNKQLLQKVGKKANQTLSRSWKDVVEEVAVHYERILGNKTNTRKT